MTRLFRSFLRRSEGAVTTDWVVMTVAVIALCLSVILIFNDGETNIATPLGNRLADAEVRQFDG